MYEAIEKNDINAVLALLKRGARVDEHRSDKKSIPLLHAKTGEMARILMDHGADPNCYGNFMKGYYHILFHTVNQNLIDVAEEILKRGVHPDKTDSRQNTPLMHAAYSLKVDFFKLFLRYGADVTLTNGFGGDVINCAIRLDISTIDKYQREDIARMKEILLAFFASGGLARLDIITRILQLALCRRPTFPDVGDLLNTVFEARRRQSRETGSDRIDKAWSAIITLFCFNAILIGIENALRLFKTCVFHATFMGCRQSMIDAAQRVVSLTPSSMDMRREMIEILSDERYPSLCDILFYHLEK